MKGTDFNEHEFFRRLESGQVRALLIGRRALVLLGLPVLTADYDFWIHIDDIGSFNSVAEAFGLIPTRTEEEARKSGRYVLENDEHVDVLVARSVPTVEGQQILFEDLWSRKRAIPLSESANAFLPSLEDLIATKHFAARPKDLEDIRLLEVLREEGNQ